MCALAATSLIACSQPGELPIPKSPLEECIYQTNKTSFSVWAPTAQAAKLRIYETATSESPVMTVDMKLGRDGLWKAVVKEDLKGMFYTFQLCHEGQWLEETQGIAAKAVGVNGTRGAIIDWNQTDPQGWEADKSPEIRPSDIIVYEMHHRDFSIHENSGIKNKGKFLALTEKGTRNPDGLATGLDHLKELGITCVQILPSYDYITVDESRPDVPQYNWGYDPQNYNAVEGSYSTDAFDPYCRIREFKQMIQTLHVEGIKVIMDVVYNHTSSAELNGFERTMPGYFYRFNPDGTWGDASGCGNETATDHKIVKEFVINSLKHWMTDYHINGFRFDLMGIHEKTTMAEIYKALSEIDKNVMVYGEPWTGGTAAVKAGCTGAVASENYGVGAFDDDFRDAIKGAEFGGFNIGQIQSANSDSGIVKGLIGKSGSNNRNSTGFTGLALHYAECHDNFTLYDKLVYSLDITNTKKLDSTGNVAKSWPASVSEEQIDLIKKQNKLAAAYIFLSQGTPFINGGQEFMRTKKGDPDSYAPDTKGGIKWTSRYNGGTYVDATDIDDVNTIDLSFKTKYADVYNTYKGLIALRKSSTAFTAGTSSTAKTLSKGVTLYNAKSDSEEYEVIFNATDKDYIITDVSIEGNLGLGMKDYEVSFGRKGKRVTINEETGEITTASEESVVSTVPAKSFVILTK